MPGNDEQLRQLPKKGYTAGHRAIPDHNNNNEVEGGNWRPDGREGEVAAPKIITNTSCFKDGAGRHNWLLPGIFTFCCMHGFILGFFVMWSAESPETAFTSLYTRRKDGKFLIIYDNACNLMMYCFRREPSFFEPTIFLIDRFHFSNHVNCTLGMTSFVYNSTSCRISNIFCYNLC